MRSAGRSFAVIALVVALAGAGCVGFASPSEPETLTPAPVPTPTPTYPPAVDAAAVDRQRIADTHARQLNATSYRVTDRSRIVVDGEVVRSSHSRRWVAADGRYNGTIDQRVGDYPIGVAIPHIEYFYNGSVAAQRYTAGNATRYRFERGAAGGLVEDRSERFPVLRHLQAFAGTVRVGAPTRDGVVLRSTEIRVPHALPLPTGVSDPRNGTLRAHVRPDGVVASIRVAYAVTAPDGGPGRVVRTIRVENIGTTTVRTPPWIDAARRNVTAG